MARRSSGPPPLLLLVFILLAAVVMLFLHQSGTLAPPRARRDRSREAKRNEGWDGMDRYPPGQRRNRRKVPASCDALATTCQSRYFGPWFTPGRAACRTTVRNGYPIPDPRCTPGGIDPTVTADVLTNPAWRTACLRNCQSSEAQKHVTYGWYGIRKPKRNSGDTQVCELDHLVPLELGGADGLGNIWPECGPDSVTLDERYFKIKDHVENYLADEVKAGKVPLQTAQRGIAADWTQYLPAANQYCERGGRC